MNLSAGSPPPNYDRRTVCADLNDMTLKDGIYRVRHTASNRPISWGGGTLATLELITTIRDTAFDDYTLRLQRLSIMNVYQQQTIKRFCWKDNYGNWNYTPWESSEAAWSDLTPSADWTFPGGTGYCRYRVRDGIMTLTASMASVAGYNTGKIYSGLPYYRECPTEITAAADVYDASAGVRTSGHVYVTGSEIYYSGNRSGWSWAADDTINFTLSWPVRVS